MMQRKAVKPAQNAASVNSFASITALWMDHWQEGKSVRHVDSVRRRMASDILPALGSPPIGAIEAPAIVAMTKAIEVGQSLKGDDVVHTLNKLKLDVLSSRCCSMKTAASSPAVPWTYGPIRTGQRSTSPD